MSKLLDTCAAEPDAVDVEVVLNPSGHQAAMLRDGRADVAILHWPFDDVSAFDVEPLTVEDQVLVLPAGHPASRSTSLTVIEGTSIPGLPVPRWPQLDGPYLNGPGPELHDLTQVLQLVLLGRAAIVLPESARANLVRAALPNLLPEPHLPLQLLLLPRRHQHTSTSSSVATT